MAGLAEPIVAFFAVTAAASALYWTGMAVPVVGDNLHGLIALLFLYAPMVAERISHRPFDYRTAGLRADPMGLNLRIAGLGVAVTWPFFFGGFLLFYGAICAHSQPDWVRAWGEYFAPLCARWQGAGGLAQITWRLPKGFALLALSQFVVIALPEELFFRGYLMSRLEQRWPSTRKFLGASVGKALLVSSVLFALGHVLVDFDPQRLAVFFPALAFGWMRAHTGSLLAGAIFHALCNLLSDVLHASFFG